MCLQRKVSMRVAFLPILLCAPCLAVQPCPPNARKLLTGSEQGNYYKLGSAIAKVAHSDGLDLCVETTSHSLDNVSELEAGHVDFAIAQSDVAHDAWYGHRPRFRDRAAHVHVVQPLYLEAVHILLRPHLSIARLEDLKGKNVGIFLPDGGTAYTAKHVLAAVGLQPEGSEKNFNAISTGDPDFCHSVLQLIEGDLDALFRVTVVPSGDIRDTVARDLDKKHTTDCAKAAEVKLLPLEHELAERLVRDGSYVETLILRDKYRQPESTLTVGVEALLLSGKSSSDDDVAHLAKLLRLKRNEIESELNQSIDKERSHQEPGESALSLAVLNVPIPALMPFVHRSARKYVYDWWRDSWRYELPELLGVCAVLAGLIIWKRRRLGDAIEHKPNLIFALASTFLIWFVAACVLYSVAGVDEHFNSFPRSLFSTFLCLASFPGYDALNQDANSYVQIARWLSIVLLGGFASPLLKEGLDSLLGKMGKWLQRETQATGRRKHKEPMQIIRPGDGSASPADAEEIRDEAHAPGAD